MITQATIMINHLCITSSLVFSLLLSSFSSQAFEVSNVFPKNLSVSNPTNVTIRVTFDEAINPATLDYSHFKVFGRWSGPAEVAFTISSDGKSIELVPFKHYFAGEWVAVNIVRSTQSSGGQSLAKAYAWNFWIATSPGSLLQQELKTIPLRNPGEGLLQTYGAYAGDLNNDGFSDLTVINETSDDLRILLNDGAGDYQDFILHSMGSSTPSPNEGADFDGDGEIDLAVCTAHDNELRILFGDGSGHFESMDVYETGAFARGLGVLDANGDGHDDVIIANRSSSNMYLYINDGTGHFNATIFNPDGTGESGLAVADANNDGIMDLFVGYYTSREIGILLGDGEGGFTQTSKQTVSGQPWMMAAADINGDGFADVVSANSSGNITVTLLGDGQGGLSLPANYPITGTAFQLAIDLGDLDGDGDLDMVTSNYGSVNYTVFENDGNGHFDVATLLPGANLASCAILHDRDNDGDLDISGTDEGDDVVILFENSGPSIVVDPKAQFQLNVYPNPTASKLHISYELKTAAQVELALYDLHGRLVSQIFSEPKASGLHFDGWQPPGSLAESMAKGQYVLIMKVDEYTLAQKITWAK